MKQLIMGYSQFVNEMYNANEDATSQPTKSVIPDGFITPENITDAEGGKAKISELQSKYAFKPEGTPISIESADLVKFYHGMPGPFAQAKQQVQSTIQSDISQYEIQNAKQGIYYRILKGSGLEDPAATVDVVGVLAGPNQAEETPATTGTPAAKPVPAPEAPVAQTEPIKEGEQPTNVLVGQPLLSYLYEIMQRSPIIGSEITEVLNKLKANGFVGETGEEIKIPEIDITDTCQISYLKAYNFQSIRNQLKQDVDRKVQNANMPEKTKQIVYRSVTSNGRWDYAEEKREEIVGVGIVILGGSTDINTAPIVKGLKPISQPADQTTATAPVYEAKRYIRNK